MYVDQTTPCSAHPLVALRTASGVASGGASWVRPLGSMESFMATGGVCGSLNTVTAVWVESQRPLEPHKVHDALRAVVR